MTKAQKTKVKKSEKRGFHSLKEDKVNNEILMYRGPYYDKEELHIMADGTSYILAIS